MRGAIQAVRATSGGILQPRRQAHRRAVGQGALEEARALRRRWDGRRNGFDEAKRRLERRPRPVGIPIGEYLGQRHAGHTGGELEVTGTGLQPGGLRREAHGDVDLLAGERHARCESERGGAQLGGHRDARRLGRPHAPLVDIASIEREGAGR